MTTLVDYILTEKYYTEVLLAKRHVAGVRGIDLCENHGGPLGAMPIGQIMFR